MLLQKFLSRKKLSRKYRSILVSKISPATGVKDLDNPFFPPTCFRVTVQFVALYFVRIREAWDICTWTWLAWPEEMPYSFWGSAVQPQATPSDTCLPHQLRITKAVLDPEQASVILFVFLDLSLSCLPTIRTIFIHMQHRTRTRKRKHTYTKKRTHARSLPRIHAHTHTHTHAQKHTQTHTH